MSCIKSIDGIKLWLLTSLINSVPVSLVICQLSHDVMAKKTRALCHWFISIRLLSQLNNCLLLVKFSVVPSLAVSFASDHQ